MLRRRRNTAASLREWYEGTFATGQSDLAGVGFATSTIPVGSFATTSF